MSHIEMVCRWYSEVLLRRSCWSSNICHISPDCVYTTNNSSGGGCTGKNEGKVCVLVLYAKLCYIINHRHNNRGGEACDFLIINCKYTVERYSNRAITLIKQSQCSEKQCSKL